MLDADFEVSGGWRLRLAVQRLRQECAQRSVVQCPKGMKVCWHFRQLLHRHLALKQPSIFAPRVRKRRK